MDWSIDEKSSVEKYIGLKYLKTNQQIKFCNYEMPLNTTTMSLHKTFFYKIMTT